MAFPALAVEHAIVTHARLHVVGFHVRAQLVAQLLRGERLADRADIVAFAFDR